MELGQKVRICDLLETYGALLSKKQQELMQEHFYMDSSLSEIAANMGITRQAVLDAITKSIAKLEDYESKLHVLEIGSNILKLQGTAQDKAILKRLKELM
jgi:predicted DNA-binding protein YlxM (UPF0122 family)